MTDLLNLSRCYPRNARQEAVVRDYLTRAATDMMVDYGRYEAAAGTTAQQAALVSFLADEPAGQGALVLTGGGQSALAAAFDFLCPPGSTVLVEAISFPLFRQLAGRRGVHVRSIASDEQGPKPEAFAEALEQGARVLYTMPTLHNPLGSVMPEPRRRELAAVARRHDGWILEDDAFQFLDTSGLPSLRSLAPERTLRVFSLSKMLSLSLRLGAVVVPPALAGDIAERVRESGNNAAGLFVATAAIMAADGALAELVAAKQQEGRERQALARRILGDGTRGHPNGYYLVMETGDESGTDFSARARAAGVLVAPAKLFRSDGCDEPWLRISLGGENGRERLTQALECLAALRCGERRPVHGLGPARDAPYTNRSR